MNDKMNPLEQFSPFAGELTEELVPGETTKKIEHENAVIAASGSDRTMYCYAPKSGCPASKQTQILMVLRDDASRDSAEKLLKEWELDKLAEEEHFLLLFPNPVKGGWNYDNAADRENDMDFLLRCFGILRGSKIRVNGFNGMLFYIAASEGASALLSTMAALKPANVSAMMTGPLPADYAFPAEALSIETAAWCTDARSIYYLKKANGVSTEGQDMQGKDVRGQDIHGLDMLDAVLFTGRNPEVRLFAGKEMTFTAGTVRAAWDKLFCLTRRWQNDTHGSYAHRTAFTERGFVAHVEDTSLHLEDGYPRTWFEYVPKQLRGCTEKVPLVLYLHGVGCVPLYGAEQSNWHDVADKEGFIVVYPAATRENCWNIFRLPNLADDFSFILALIEHMKAVYPIDGRRIYISGFSMGGMMTHALANTYPEVFAAAAPCNAFHMSRYGDPAAVLKGFVAGYTEEELGHISYSKSMADVKNSAKDYLMPIFQNAGYDDGIIAMWPVTEEMDDVRTETLKWWKRYNHISEKSFTDEDTCTGLAAEETFYEDTEKRYVHQRWYGEEEGKPALMELVVAKRMQHAIHPIQIEWAWDYIKQFGRAEDGTLIVF
ncbi:MAG: prolyl oligopeptidase family serine peptidase [Clostridiales bacterium]|nr:prolyl oligopeptidase family serine peptidase [Clostridiales bacterium]